MISKLQQYIIAIKRFCYYGYHGSRYTYDFDASGIHDMIYAHISRVEAFMHNPKLTHLMWNSNPQNKNMRLLRELKELSRRIKDGYCVGRYTSEVFDSYRKENGSLMNLLQERPPRFSKELKIARKKDAMIRKGLEDRYWFLLRYKAPEFWD